MTKIQISYHKEGRNLVVIWEDNGVGIAEANKKNIYGIGWRLQGPRMYFVREYLSATDITIIENGEPGKGARFELMVPDGMWRKTGKGT